MSQQSQYPKFGPGQSLLSVQQFDRESLGAFFDLADATAPLANREQVSTILQGAVLGSLFFEPSTRTRLSFESAFSRLGGLVTTTTGFSFSSMAKGESIADTARVVGGYSDVLVIRHPDEGSVAEFSESSPCPVLNAGDGAGEHPSQALLDVYTMRKELGERNKTIDGSTIAILGDLKYGRTVHSLIKLLSLYENLTFQVFAPPSLDLPNYVAKYASEAGHKVIHCETVGEALTGSDVVYATRVQRERMSEEVKANTELSGDLLNKELMLKYADPETIICHPLPRDSRPNSYDLATDVDSLPGLAIFRQTDNGVLVRMALFLTTLGIDIPTLQASFTPAPWSIEKK